MQFISNSILVYSLHISNTLQLSFFPSYDVQASHILVTGTRVMQVYIIGHKFLILYLFFCHSTFIFCSSLFDAPGPFYKYRSIIIAYNQLFLQPTLSYIVQLRDFIAHIKSGM